MAGDGVARIGPVRLGLAGMGGVDGRVMAALGKAWQDDHMTMDPDKFIVFEVIERRRGVTQQDPDVMVSHGLFSSRYRANKKRKELRLRGIGGSVTIERDVN